MSQPLQPFPRLSSPPSTSHNGRRHSRRAPKFNRSGQAMPLSNQLHPHSAASLCQHRHGNFEFPSLDLPIRQPVKTHARWASPIRTFHCVHHLYQISLIFSPEIASVHTEWPLLKLRGNSRILADSTGLKVQIFGALMSRPSYSGKRGRTELRI
jgi:hypothetical protein